MEEKTEKDGSCENGNFATGTPHAVYRTELAAERPGGRVDAPVHIHPRVNTRRPVAHSQPSRLLDHSMDSSSPCVLCLINVMLSDRYSLVLHFPPDITISPRGCHPSNPSNPTKTSSTKTSRAVDELLSRFLLLWTEQTTRISSACVTCHKQFWGCVISRWWRYRCVIILSRNLLQWTKLTTWNICAWHEVFRAVTMKNVVFWDIKTQFIPHRRHITSPLQSPAS
jgi:hypothetical protein